MKRNTLVVALVLTLVLVALSGIYSGAIRGFGRTAAQTQPTMDVYSVKFLCGNFAPAPPKVPPDGVEYPVKPGNYFTAINLHNPNGGALSFQKKAVLMYRADQPGDPETPMKPSGLIQAGLDSDWGLEIDCTDIRNKLLGGAVSAPTFIKGWVVIEVRGNQLHQTTPAPLDVTAVYTAHGWDRQGAKLIYNGFAEDIVTVLPKTVK